MGGAYANDWIDQHAQRCGRAKNFERVAKVDGVQSKPALASETAYVATDVMQ
jgi:hypothetical protein